MDTNEDPPIIRSINNNHPSYVRFINATSYEVQVLWINYEGQAVSYGILDAGDHLDIGTYVTHPWIFVEMRTMERFMVNGNDVYYPERVDRKSPNLVYITIPMYSLREIAMRTIKLLLLDDNDAYLLDIPKNLQRELVDMEPRKHRP